MLRLSPKAIHQLKDSFPVQEDDRSRHSGRELADDLLLRIRCEASADRDDEGGDEAWISRPKIEIWHREGVFRLTKQFVDGGVHFAADISGLCLEPVVA